MSEKLFRPLVILYIVYALFHIYLYLRSMTLDFGHSDLNILYGKKILGMLLVLMAGMALKYYGKDKTAFLILAIPAGIKLALFLIAVLAWVFLAVVMNIFSKG